MWFADGEMLTHVEPLRTILWEVTTAAGATIVTEQAIQFSPHGVTILLGLAESHLLAQSWVMERLLTVDVTTCGDARIDDLVGSLIARLEPLRHRVVKVPRGDFEE